MKSNKSISRIFFDQIPFFAISNMAKNQFFELGKTLKLAEMQFHKKYFRKIACWAVLNFLPVQKLIFGHF